LEGLEEKEKKQLLINKGSV